MGQSSEQYIEIRDQEQFAENLNQFNPKPFSFGLFENQMADIAEKVEEGESDALEKFALISRLEKIVKAVKEQIQPIAIKEASRMEKSELKDSGFSMRPGYRKLDFKGIPEFDESQENIKAIKDKYKKLVSDLDAILNEEAEISARSDFEQNDPRLSIIEQKKEILAEEFGCDSVDDLFLLLPDVTITKSSISYIQPKRSNEQKHI